MSAGGVLVLGHFGGGNAGDEAILDGTCHLLAAVGYDHVRVVARSADYEPQVSAPVTIAVVPAQLRSVLRSVGRAPLVVLAGGTHFHDDYPRRRRLRHYRYLSRYLAVLGLARVLGRPVVALGQGIGPLVHPVGRILTLALFALVRSGTVRDDASLVRARALGATTAGWRRTFDTAAAVPRFSAEANAPRTTIAIAPLGVHALGQPHPAEWCTDTVVDVLAAAGCADVAVLAFRTGDRESDNDVAAPLARRLGTRVLTADEGLDTLVAAMADARVVLCGRYHALVLALLAGAVPVVLPGHAKLADTAGLVGLPATLIVSDLAALEDALAAALDFDARKLRPALDDFRAALDHDRDLLARQRCVAEGRVATPQRRLVAVRERT